MRRIGPRTQARIDRLRSMVRALPDDAKMRVVKGTKWTCLQLARADDARCLIGHAEIRYDQAAWANGELIWHGSILAADFDALSVRIGLSATVALVKDALGVLK